MVLQFGCKARAENPQHTKPDVYKMAHGTSDFDTVFGVT